MCVLVFSKTFVWNISHSKKSWARYDKICCGLQVKYPLFLSDFFWNLNFLGRFSKNAHMSYFMKIHPGEPSCSMRAGRRMDGQDEANSRFSQFCERAQLLLFLPML
jgi:hypothetical protein